MTRSDGLSLTGPTPYRGGGWDWDRWDTVGISETPQVKHGGTGAGTGGNGRVLSHPVSHPETGSQ